MPCPPRTVAHVAITDEPSSVAKTNHKEPLLQRINAATLPCASASARHEWPGSAPQGSQRRPRSGWQSPLPRKHTIGLLVLILLWLIVLAWEPSPAHRRPPRPVPLAVPLAVPAQALTVGSETAGSAPAATAGRGEGGRHLAAHDGAGGRDPLLHLAQVRAAGAELSRPSPSKGQIAR